jgi:hypothetical protein
VEDLDALDLLQRAHAFAHDPLDALQELLAQSAGAGVLTQHVLRLVDLPGAGGVDLITLGGGERADLLRFRRGCGGDLLRFGEASRRLHVGLGLGRDPQRLAFGLAPRGNQVGELAPFGDLPLAGRDRLLLGLDDLGAHRLGRRERGGTLRRLLRQLDGLRHLRDLDELVALGRERADVAILGDARFFDTALGGDAGALDVLRGGDLGLFEGLALGDLQSFEMALALEPHLVERAVLGNALGLGMLVLDDLGAALLGLGLDHRQGLLGESGLPVELQDFERLLPVDLQLALLALACNARRLELQFDVDLLAFGLLAGLELGFVERPAAGDFAALRILFVPDALLGDRALLGQPRLFDRLARGELRLLRLLLAQRPLPGQLGTLDRAAELDFPLLLEPRVFGLPVDLEDLLLRLQVLAADFNQGALLDLVAHLAPRFDRFGELGQTFGVEGVRRIEIFEAGLVEVDDGDVLQLQAIGGERLGGEVADLLA